MTCGENRRGIEFDLMEPDELQLAVVYDDVLYFAYYDFSTGIWKMDSKSVKLNNWPTIQIKNDFLIVWSIVVC